MTVIKSLSGLEILDSRGNPTIECYCMLDNGVVSHAAVPSGVSTGSMEAFEMRDNDPARYHGKGVLKAISKLNEIIMPNLVGIDPYAQEEIDDLMLSLDATENLSNLGANTILAASLAVAKAGAIDSGVEFYRYISDDISYTMPIPFMNILNGGQHASNNIDIQEFMVVPVGFGSFRDALRAGCEIYHALAAILKSRGYSTAVGDEGGFAPNLKTVDDAFILIMEAIAKAGYKAGEDIYLAVDIAASEFYKDNCYNLQSDNKKYSKEEWLNELVKMTKKYPIISIEDAMAENDIEGWQLLTKKLGAKVQLVGDDLFVTQAKILHAGIKQGMANSILIKPNQVGTLTGTLLTIGLAKKEQYGFMISHRSGETCDTLIADLAVGCAAGQIKTGAPCRGERLAKYNRLLQIEQQLGSNAKYHINDVLAHYLSVLG